MPAHTHPFGTRFVSGLVLALSTLLTAAPVQADINQFIVYHSQSYTQDASGLSGPTLSVQASVLSNVKGEFDGGTVTAPDGSVYNVLNQSSASYPFDQFGAYFGPQPFGTFTAHLTNGATLAQGLASLTYASDHDPDVAPRVSNYAALQHFDPTQDNSILLTSGFSVPAGATGASTTFFIFDAKTNARLLQYSTDPATTAFSVPANTGAPGEAIGYYFESDINFATTVNGVSNVEVYRKITTGEINAAPVPEPASAVLMLAGAAALVVRRRMGEQRR